MEKNQIKLKEELAPKDILAYFEEKYETQEIVSPKTIYNWLRKLKIDCIQPRPSRNRDIRYKKSDVLKLEKAKGHRLKSLQHKYKQKEDYEKRAQIERDKFKAYYDQMTDQDSQEDLALYEVQAKKIIQEDMLRMTFERLFPTTSFDSQELARNLRVVDLKDIEDFAKEEDGLSIDYIENKLYIKNKKSKE